MFNQCEEMQTAVVWTCLTFIRSGQNHLARYSERGKKTQQMEKEVGRHRQGMTQAWRSPSHRRQWRTGKDGEIWLQNHPWCSIDPRGQGRDDDNYDDLIQRLSKQRGSPCQDPAGNRATRRPPDHRKETQPAAVWACLPFIRSGQNHLARHNKRGKKTRQTKEEVGRKHQGMDRPEVRQVTEGSGEQGKMEKTGCEIICDAPTTLAVKGQMIMMMVIWDSLSTLKKKKKKQASLRCMRV